MYSIIWISQKELKLYRAKSFFSAKKNEIILESRFGRVIDITIDGCLNIS